jgi:GT2 family glycosyltransferase
MPSLSVAVLIVNFRVYDDLDRALRTLDPFLDPGDQVAVVDQESDADRFDRVAAAHPRIVAIRSARNVGFAAGVNLAARHTTAPYLLLLNPDAVLESAVVRTLEQWLIDHPDTAVVAPRVLDSDGSVQASARRFPGPSAALAGRSTWLTNVFPNNWLSRRNLPGRSTIDPMDVDWLAGSCLMTRRDVFDRVGGFDERFFLYWEDADYCRRVAALGYRRTYLPVVHVRHAGGRSAAAVPAVSIRAFHASAFHLYWKHSGVVGRLFAPITRVGLWARGEWRVRRALARLRAAGGSKDQRP